MSVITFFYSRHKLDMRETMRYELLIIFCISYLNSLTVERGSNYDRIFSVSDDKCGNIFYGEKEDNICECSEDNNTFLSTEKGHYSCSSEVELGRLI